MAIPTHIVSVGAFIENDQEEILLIKSPRRGWEPPGGQVEVGEDLITALKREVLEETGLVVDIHQLIGVYSNIGTETINTTTIPTKVMFSFSSRVVTGTLTTSVESLEIGWFKRNKIIGTIPLPFMQDRARDFLEYDGRVVYKAFTKNPYQIHIQQYFAPEV